MNSITAHTTTIGPIVNIRHRGIFTLSDDDVYTYLEAYTPPSCFSGIYESPSGKREFLHYSEWHVIKRREKSIPVDDNNPDDGAVWETVMEKRPTCGRREMK